jgi:hypothetical protein
MTAPAASALRVQLARVLCGTPPDVRCNCERDGNAVPCPDRLAAADKCLALIRPAVLRECADLGESLIDAARDEALGEAAKIADAHSCGLCGMDGKAGKAIRALAKEPQHDE